MTSTGPAPGTPKSPPLTDLTASQVQWIGAGYLMTFASMPGQTVFIAQFNAAIREHFGLSHGEFGLIYTLATLSSSVVLVFAGALADRHAPRTLALICMGALAAVAVAMSQVNHVFLLVPILFGLRLFGQGMMGHIAMTAMARWFFRFRGRALSLAQMGFPTGEAVLPFAVTLAIGAIGWRQVWLLAAAVLVLILCPLVAFLVRDPPDGRRARARGAVNPDGDTATTPVGAQWTRRAVIRDPLFYFLLPGFMGAPAIGTLFIFHQAHLSALKGWDITTFTAFFPVLSVTVVGVALLAGVLIDRYGAFRIVPAVLVPLGTGCVALGLFDGFWMIPVFFITFGMTNGLQAPIVGALWAEIYGSAHIGAIRALATAAFVLASAVGPGLAGMLIDAGIELEAQAFFYAAYCIAMSAIYFAVRPYLAQRAAAIEAERLTLAG